MSHELEAAIKLHQAGRLREAEAAYRKLLDANPRDAQAIHLLGLVAHQTAHHQQAVSLIQQAIAINPTVPAFYKNLASVYRAQGQLTQSINTYRQATQRLPDSGELWTNLGGCLFDAGEHQAAIQACQRAIKLAPNIAAAHSNLGNAQRATGAFSAARKSHETALRLRPDAAMLHINYAELLQEVGESGGAVAHCQQATQLEANNPNCHMALGLVQRTAGQLVEAERAFRRVLQLQPRSAMALAQLAQIQDALGQRDAALEQYRKAIELDPHCMLAWVNLGTYHRTQVTGRELDAMRALVEHPQLPDGARSGLRFALGQVLDLHDEFAAAAEQMNAGNGLQMQVNQRRGRSYDPAVHQAHIDEIIKCFDEEYFQRTLAELDAGNDSRLPITIVGMPRSGTSLTEQILASHGDIFGGGELQLLRRSWESAMKLMSPDASLRQRLLPLAAETVTAAAQDYLQRLQRLNPQAKHVTDKLPENYLCLGWVATMFPQASVIHCCRHDAATAFSCWQTSFEGVRWANDPHHIATRLQQYHRLMKHWEAVLPQDIFDVSYEQTVTQTEETARKLLQNLDLPWDQRCLSAHVTTRPVQTASVTQVREPIYTRSLNRWQQYVEFLPELLEPLAQM